MSGTVRLLSGDEAQGFRPDVAIVGTGAGSLSVAGELARKGARVLLVESGPVWGGAPARHRRNEVAQYDDYVDELFSRLLPHANAAQPTSGLPGAKGVHGVGGMMSYWAHMVPRPDMDSEWGGPLGVDVLSAYLTRVEQLMWATDDLYGQGSPRQRWIVSTLLERFGAGFVRLPELAGCRTDGGGIEWAGGDNLLAGGEQNCAVLPRAVARRVKLAGGRAQSVEVLCLDDSSRIEIEAETLVIGGGTLGTPQLLAASGLADLPALGGYLMDHLNIISRVILRDDCPSDSEGDEPVWLRVPPTSTLDFQVGILDIPSKAHLGQLSGAEDLKTTDIGVFLGTDPVATNRLSFDASRPDGFGLPTVSAHVSLTEGDHARVRQALATQYDIAAAIGEPWRGMNPILQPFGGSLHLMGTYRIGTDAATSVADANCRVWGYDNLYLAGNGLLGWKNHCNPTLTTMALGLAAADAIGAR